MRLYSPISKTKKLSKYLNIDLRVKRDDLLLAPGGGNKVRKIYKILNEAEKENCNALVTTGGLQSNHCRIVSLFAAEKGWRCKLVLHGNSSYLKKPTGNLLLMIISGAEIIIVPPDKISITMKKSIKDFRDEGFIPYEIPGGGHCIAGGAAYIEAIDELREQCEEDGWWPEWIILASGTGTTQAGLLVGLERLRIPIKVIGISVARRNPSGKSVVVQMCQELRKAFQIDTNEFSIPVDFRDDWVSGGYESSDKKVFRAIKMAAEMEGLILDPTYTGKAFSAMLDLIDSGEIPKGSKVLFWHTGGIFNLMASDYIRDILTS